jgi:hypothetical protein
MNLYMVSLGGKVTGCNIEVHDVQFVIANHIDETVGLLKSTWYGLGHKLHMDSYKAITGADGYKIQLTKVKPNNTKQLFFVQFGGYKKECTQELHDIGLFVGESEADVKERALKLVQIADIENHVDSILPIETVIRSIDGETYFIELVESMEYFDQSPDWFGYRRLDIETI